MRQHNLKVTGSLQINGENVISASELSTLSASINSKIEGLNPSQIGTGSYTASISPNGAFSVNTNTIITGSLSVTSLSGSGINYLAYSGGVVTAISGTAAIKYNQEFTATLGQTTFTPSIGYITNLIDVFYNGTKLSAQTDYTASNGSTVILTQAADKDGDIVEVAIYNPVSGVSNNTLRQQTTFTASASQTTFTVNYTPGLLDVFFNGSKLSNDEYTANNGTSIILSEAATGGEIVDVFVYSYQVGAFSGVGGQGVLNQLAYWSSQSGLTGSNSLTFDGSTLTISGSLVPAVSGAYDLGSTSKPFRHIYVGSGSIYLVNNQGQVTNTISAQSIVTTDTLNSGSINLVNSLPTGTVSGSSQVVDILTSLNTATASFTPRISNLESKSASVDISITNINSFTASNGNTSLNLLTGSLATTGSNTFRGTTIMSGSTYVTGDFVVFGSSSIQYISASSVSIGTNVVNLNTNQPAVRFAGMSVQDSGSAVGVTGSMFWDGCCNRWIYSNPSGVGYSGGVLMSGPRGSTLGNEPTLTCNYIAKSGGGDHLYDSCIIDDGNIISFNAPTGSFSGKIGIGTNCPANVLHIKSSLPRLIVETTDRYAVFNMWAGGSEKGAMYWDNTDLAYKFESNQGYSFIAGGSERLRITCAGNVGIGTCIPNAISTYTTLDIRGTTGGGLKMGVLGSSNTFNIQQDNTDVYFNNVANANMYFWTNNTERMRISCTGTIGINTDTLTASGLTGNVLYIRSHTGNNGQTAIAIQDYRKCTRWAINGQDGLDNFNFAIYSTPCNTNDYSRRFSITQDGNVGIGSHTPVEGVDIQMALRIRCNTPNFTAACNSLVIDYVNTCIFGSSPTARYYSIGCTGVSAGHQFLVGVPASGYTALNINGSGVVTRQCQPYFYADTLNGANLSGTTTPIWTNLRASQGSGYSTSTGRFTAPVTGVYSFSWAYLYGGISNYAGCIDDGFSLNGTQIFSGNRFKISQKATGDGYVAVQGSVVLKLTANDYFSVLTNNAGDASLVGYGGSTWGYLTGALL